MGVWSLVEGGGEFGGRLTRNRNEWFAMEYGLTYRPSAKVRDPSGLAVVNIRLSVPLPHSRNPVRAFLTLGGAAGNSANFSVSPMIGAGFQVTPRGPYGRPGFLMLRAELQFFLRGRSLDDRGRLMLGFVIPFGGR